MEEIINGVNKDRKRNGTGIEPREYSSINESGGWEATNNKDWGITNEGRRKTRQVGWPRAKWRKHKKSV